MKLVAHPSPLVLESELLDRVAAARSGDPIAPILIIVPSRRLADHVSRRLVERFGAVLGVHVLHHRALAERVLETAGVTPSRLIDDALLDTLLAKVVRRAETGPLCDFVRDHPGAASALRTTLTDLREAGIEPAAVTEALSGPEAETAKLYVRWTAALDQIRERADATDAAGLAADAAMHARSFAVRFASILHHGAYDLIGVHVDLVRALDRGREVTLLWPVDLVDASGAFGVDRGRAIAGPHATLEPLDRVVAPAPAVYLHAQGARAELDNAAYEALAAVASGVPPHEVALVVRSFGPYAAALDAWIDDGPRWHTGCERPLRRDPTAAAALRAIAAAEDHGPRSFQEHADRFETIARAAPVGDGLARLFESMREIETLLGEERPFPRAEALAWLDARADATTMPPEGSDGGGIRILDAMQARGLTFRHVGLLGMNAGVFPRVAREDPFLADSSRARLRGATGRPLPMASEGDGEERLLLAMLRASAREQLRVSWRRADESGRPVVPSLALRELVHEARALPAHPRFRLEAWARTPGLLRPDEETLLAALASETGAEAGPAVAERRPELSAGVALVAATETFAPGSGAYDGRIGAGVARARLAVTAVERLGVCPLRFFFGDVIRVRAGIEPATPFTADAAAVGTRVHAVLRDVYERLTREGAFDGDDVVGRIARARGLLGEAWHRAATEEDAARAVRLPLLDAIESAARLETLGAFVAADLARMAREGVAPARLEHPVEQAIPGGPEGLVVTGRFDRVLHGHGGSVVGDYKSGGDLRARMKSGAMLSGEQLQVPIYALLSGAPVELLGVGPRHAPEADDDNEDPRFERFEGFDSPEQRDGVLETVRVLFALVIAGRFPIRPGDHCAHCDYAAACRHGHPPTRHRENRAEDVVDARDCWEKTDKLRTLAAVRAGATR